MEWQTLVGTGGSYLLQDMSVWKVILSLNVWKKHLKFIESLNYKQKNSCGKACLAQCLEQGCH